MNTNTPFDRVLGRWLEAEASAAAPIGLHDAAVERAHQVRQRPRWLTALRGETFPRSVSPSDRRAARVRLDLRWAVAAVAVVTVAVGAGLVLKLAPVTTVGPSTSPSTTAPTSLSTAPAPSMTPAPLPTARPVALIAFVRELDNPPAGTLGGPHRLWVVATDGSGARDLFPNDLASDKVDPAWSPDGSRLIFSYLGNLGGGKLYLTDASGSAPVLLDTGCPECADSDASFSSDGSRIVFVRTRKESTQGAQAEIWHTVIATMDLATGRVVELASTAELGDAAPRWSPDGTQIAFHRSWFAMPEKLLRAAAFVVDADGQHLRQLSPAALQARSPDWSSDGSRIVFETIDMRIVGQSVPITDDIYSIRPDGTGLRRLTTDGLSNGATWIADGRILFTRVLGGASGRAAGGFWLMDADGGNVTQLVPAATIADDNFYESGAGRDAAWQPIP